MKSPKYLYQLGVKQKVNNINVYLIDSNNIIISKATKPLSKFAKMSYGSKPVDGGNLILTTLEKDKLIEDNPSASIFIKKFVGSHEFINSIERWCLWIEDTDLDLALSVTKIKNRIDNVYNMRLNSPKKATQEASNYSHQFGEPRFKAEDSIIVPAVSSESREYIPIGYLTSNTVISNSANAIYSAEPWLFAVIISKMHMTWMRTVAGRLKTDYRYSSALVYNTFPFPPITKKQKETLTQHTFAVLDEREKHSEKTLAQLYDPDKMPQGLKEAHRQLDLAIERCYRKKPFESDEERLEYLFKLYEEMVEKEK